MCLSVLISVFDYQQSIFGKDKAFPDNNTRYVTPNIKIRHIIQKQNN